ncbi:Uncharacterized protein Adt_37737 [Abeliophyllum distichum]|uniref:Uncharacterized protein n=1 Tax=Abeliophyllum distichum TaxID=126358 RepID=A0ABD1Q4A5_9LAMI
MEGCLYGKSGYQSALSFRHTDEQACSNPMGGWWNFLWSLIYPEKLDSVWKIIWAILPTMVLSRIGISIRKEYLHGEVRDQKPYVTHCLSAVQLKEPGYIVHLENW